MDTNLNSPKGTKVVGDHGPEADSRYTLPSYYKPRAYVYGASNPRLRPVVVVIDGEEV
jgi:hypothetical protein